MAAIPSRTNQSLFNQLLDYAKRLGEADIRAFIKALVNLLPNRKPEGEQDLIQALQENSPSLEFWAEYNSLADKSDEETLTDAERARFLVLTKEVREWELKRLQLTLQLSKVWEITLNEAMSIVKTILTSSTTDKTVSILLS